MKPIRTLRERGARYLFLAGVDRLHCELSVLPFYRPLAERYYRSKTRDVDEYEVPMRPFAKRFVDPDKIVHTSEFRGHTYPPNRCMRQFGRVVGGDWDKDTDRFDEKPIYRTLRQRFEEGIDWKETPYVREAIEMVQDGERKWHGCSSIRDIERRCEYLEKLYKNIERNGFQLQKDIRSKISYPREFIDEIRIDIGRDGRPLYVDGKHRLSIAKIQKINKIPVTVMVRHPEWMTTLEKTYRQGEPLCHFDHVTSGQYNKNSATSAVNG